MTLTNFFFCFDLPLTGDWSSTLGSARQGSCVVQAISVKAILEEKSREKNETVYMNTISLHVYYYHLLFG